jgi:hypothetical protein
MKAEPFKICPNCAHTWSTTDSFLSDPLLELAGYQVNFFELEGGLFLFNHKRNDCGTTLAIAVKSFAALTDNPIISKRTVQPNDCPELCMRECDLGVCPAECECSWVRQTLNVIKKWPKSA